MSVCYHTDGILSLKEGGAEDFADRLDALLDMYDPGHASKLTEDGRFMFRAYCRHGVIDDTQKLMADGIDSIKEGKVWFTCLDEDGSEHGFDFSVYREIHDGFIDESSLVTRLPCEWECRHRDPEWEENPTRRDANKRQLE